MAPTNVWDIAIPIVLGVLMIFYLTMSLWYKNQYGRYNTSQPSVNTLLTIQNSTLSATLQSFPHNTKSVCTNLLAKKPPYNSIPENSTPIVNWRPLTVRLAGYLGGDTGVINGVFDMTKGIKYALDLGARSFIFDIDYLEVAPCVPCVIHRDSQGIMRSLNTGNLREAMIALNTYAFTENYDPVIIVLYLRRLPPGPNQQSAFLKAIAASLNNIVSYHLGSTEQGNFHNCRSESILFRGKITSFQKKFIVLCNYDTTQLPSTHNPRDNLDFWTNARIWLDPNGQSVRLGDVTTTAPSSPPAYVTVGDTVQLLNYPGADSVSNDYLTSGAITFKIALGSVEDMFTVAQLSLLLNNLGIQCVPIDVVRLGMSPEYKKTLAYLQNNNVPSSKEALSNAVVPTDPLSFWAYSGWSKKYMNDTVTTEGFQDTKPVPVAKRIPGFIIPNPVMPKKPPPSTNSNGGLVSIQ